MRLEQKLKLREQPLTLAGEWGYEGDGASFSLVRCLAKAVTFTRASHFPSQLLVRTASDVPGGKSLERLDMYVNSVLKAVNQSGSELTVNREKVTSDLMMLTIKVQ